MQAHDGICPAHKHIPQYTTITSPATLHDLLLTPGQQLQCLAHLIAVLQLLRLADGVLDHLHGKRRRQRQRRPVRAGRLRGKQKTDIYSGGAGGVRQLVQGRRRGAR